MQFASVRRGFQYVSEFEIGTQFSWTLCIVNDINESQNKNKNMATIPLTEREISQAGEVGDLWQLSVCAMKISGQLWKERS